jgi:hypothetical protein
MALKPVYEYGIRYTLVDYRILIYKLYNSKSLGLCELRNLTILCLIDSDVVEPK